MMKPYKFLFIVLLVLPFFAANAFAVNLHYQEISDSYRQIIYHVPVKDWEAEVNDYWARVYRKTLGASMEIKKATKYTTDLQALYNNELEALKKLTPQHQMVKENQSVTLTGVTKALSFSLLNTSNNNVIREILYIHNNQPYVVKFEFPKSNFETLKPEMKFLRDALKVPSQKLTKLTVKDYDIKVGFTAPNTQWHYKLKDGYSFFYHKVHTFMEFNFYFSIYSKDDILKANKEYLEYHRKNYGAMTMLEEGKTVDVKGVKFAYSTYKNTNNYIIKAMNFVHSGRSLMIQLFSKEAYHSEVKNDFAELFKSIEFL